MVCTEESWLPKGFAGDGSKYVVRNLTTVMEGATETQVFINLELDFLIVGRGGQRIRRMPSALWLLKPHDFLRRIFSAVAARIAAVVHARVKLD